MVSRVSFEMNPVIKMIDEIIHFHHPPSSSVYKKTPKRMSAFFSALYPALLVCYTLPVYPIAFLEEHGAHPSADSGLENAVALISYRILACQVDVNLCE